MQRGDRCSSGLVPSIKSSILANMIREAGIDVQILNAH